MIFPNVLAVAADYDFSLRQLAVMELLAGEMAGASVKPIARRLGMPSPSVTRAVERLVQDGLAQRIQNPDDRRCVICTLTPRGETLWRRIAASVGEGA